MSEIETAALIMSQTWDMEGRGDTVVIVAEDASGVDFYEKLEDGLWFFFTFHNDNYPPTGKGFIRKTDDQMAAEIMDVCNGRYIRYNGAGLNIGGEYVRDQLDTEDEYEGYPYSDWLYARSNGSTTLDYLPWVKEQQDTRTE